MAFGHACHRVIGELCVVEIDEEATTKASLTDDFVSFVQSCIQFAMLSDVRRPSALKVVHNGIVEANVAVENATKIDEPFVD